MTDTPVVWRIGSKVGQRGLRRQGRLRQQIARTVPDWDRRRDWRYSAV